MDQEGWVLPDFSEANAVYAQIRQGAVECAAQVNRKPREFSYRGWRGFESSINNGLDITVRRGNIVLGVSYAAPRFDKYPNPEVAAHARARQVAKLALDKFD